MCKSDMTGGGPKRNKDRANGWDRIGVGPAKGLVIVSKKKQWGMRGGPSLKTFAYYNAGGLTAKNARFRGRPKMPGLEKRTRIMGAF